MKRFKQAQEWGRQTTKDGFGWIVGLSLDNKCHVVMIHRKTGWNTKRFTKQEQAKEAYNETIKTWTAANLI